MKFKKNYRIGFDIGGTFTDIVLYNIQKKEIHLLLNELISFKSTFIRFLVDRSGSL